MEARLPSPSALLIFQTSIGATNVALFFDTTLRPQQPRPTNSYHISTITAFLRGRVARSCATAYAERQQVWQLATESTRPETT
jgi:hypothetical protein